MSAAEWKIRVDLAAVYQVFHQKGWTDGINTHLSARSADDPNHLYLKPHEQMFHQVTASDLVKVDLDGNLVDPDGEQVNLAGAIIHSAVMVGRPDVNCVLHHHTDAGIAVSSLEVGLLPMSQHALQFHGRMSYHEYEGPALDPAERASLQRDLGKNNAMLMRNHGVLVTGASVGIAYASCDKLEIACRAQLLAMQTGAKIHLPSREVQDHTAAMYKGAIGGQADTVEWQAMLGWLDDLGVRYAE
jgi:ribulose-5-phosphate 4-epimerase/fuculose-1-phosphate aldolase